MDQSFDTNTLRQDAYTAAQDANKMATDAPGMLTQLKQNLVGIFSKDNPIMQARDNALSGYLSTAANTRASLLPGGMPMVEGRNLTLSPTQQNAIVTSRENAALAPLAGYNEILKGMYGNIGEMVGGAGDIYGAQIQGAQNNAATLLDFYRQAVAEEESRRSGSGAAGMDLGSIMAAIQTMLGVNGQQPDYNSVLDEEYGGGGPVGSFGISSNLLDVSNFGAQPKQQSKYLPAPTALPKPTNKKSSRPALDTSRSSGQSAMLNF
jgi:hypothetical protein